jgi:hypothetical protein
MKMAPGKSLPASGWSALCRQHRHEEKHARRERVSTGPNPLRRFSLRPPNQASKVRFAPTQAGEAEAPHVRMHQSTHTPALTITDCSPAWRMIACRRATAGAEDYHQRAIGLSSEN